MLVFHYASGPKNHTVTKRCAMEFVQCALTFEEYAQWILTKWLKLPGSLTHRNVFLFSNHFFSIYFFFFFLYCHFILHCKGTTHTAYFGKCRVQMDFQRFVFRSKLPEQAYTFLSRFLWLPGDGFNFCPGPVVTGERKCGHAGWIKSVTSCTAVPKWPVSRIT